MSEMVDCKLISYLINISITFYLHTGVFIIDDLVTTVRKSPHHDSYYLFTLFIESFCAIPCAAAVHAVY